MGIFKSRKQVEELKSINLNVAKEMYQTVKLSGVRIVYSVGQTEPYKAYIDYQERPRDWNNHGSSYQEEITAQSWPELIDKVVKHFEGSKPSSKGTSHESGTETS